MASEAMREATGWQPIETAPKDGTLILLAGGSWSDDEDDLKPNPVVRPVGAARWRNDRFGGSWVVVAAEAGYSLFQYEAPTHWMPLPRPPPAKP